MKPYKKPRKPGDAGFYRGVIAALGALKGMCGATSTEYHEVARTFDLDELLHSARRGGDMRWSGLGEYIQDRKKEDALRDSLPAQYPQEAK